MDPGVVAGWINCAYLFTYLLDQPVFIEVNDLDYMHIVYFSA